MPVKHSRQSVTGNAKHLRCLGHVQAERLQTVTVTLDTHAAIKRLTASGISTE